MDMIRLPVEQEQRLGGVLVKQMRKESKLWIVVAIFILVLSLFCSASADSSEGIGATSGTCGSKATWTYTDGVLTISGTGGMANYTSASGTPWEARKSSITAVVVENGITSVGDYAFYDCDSLTSVSLPEGLRTIGNYALYSCNALSTINLPSGVTSLGSYSFAYNEKLKNVTLPSTLTTIGSNAFYCCSALTKITLPEELTAIQYEAFYGTNLSEITIPNSVSQMGAGAFSNCYNLSTVNLSSSLATLPESAFASNYYGPYNKISEITIPEGVTNIGKSVFASAAQLTTVHLPLSLEGISTSAFYNCENLANIYYAGTQEQAESILIGTSNTNLTSATWHFGSSGQGGEEPSNKLGDNLTWEISSAGALTIKGTGTMANLTGNAPWSDQINKITTVTIENGVSSIGSNAFAGCDQVLIVNLPSTVTIIGESAFAQCPEIKVVNYAGTTAQKEMITIGSGNSSQYLAIRQPSRDQRSLSLMVVLLLILHILLASQETDITSLI